MAKINCFSAFTRTEFDKIEATAFKIAQQTKRSTPTNADYAAAVEGLLEATRKRISAIEAAAKESAQTKPQEKPAEPAPKPSEAKTDEAKTEEDTPAPIDEETLAREAEGHNALIEKVEDAKTEEDYAKAMDALYAAWIDARTDSSEIDKYIEENRASNAFLKAWNAAEDRYDQRTKPKRIKTGNHPGATGEQTKDAASALSMALFGTKFSTGSLVPGWAKRGGKPSVAALEKFVKGLQNFSRFALPIDIVPTPEAAGIKPPPGGEKAVGALHNGRIYLFSDNLSSMTEARVTLFHELFHYGLSKVLQPAEYHGVLKQFANEPLIAKYVENWKASPEGKARQKDMTAQAYETLATEEAMARVAEDLTRSGGIGTKGYSLLRAVARVLANVADRLGFDDVGRTLRRMTQTEAERFVTQTIQQSFGPQGNPQVKAGDKVTSRYSTRSEAIAGDMRATLAASPLGGIGEYISDRIYDLREQPWVFGWLTNAQLAEEFKHIASLQTIHDGMRKMSQVANHFMGIWHKTDMLWRALSDAEAVGVQRSMLGTTLAQSDVAVSENLQEAWEHEANAHLSKTKPKIKEKFDRLHQEYWAMNEKQRKVYGAVRDALKAQFDARVNELQDQIVRAYATTLGRTLNAAEALRLRESATLDDAKIDDITTRAQKRALALLRQDLIDNYNATHGALKGPYFPLVRFGDHVVVMKSSNIMELEAQRKGITDAIEKLQAADTEERADITDSETAKLREQLKEVDKMIDMFKEDEAHYSVEFFERPSEARDALEALKAKYPTAEVYPTVREEYFRGLDSATPAFFNNLTKAVEMALDAGGSKVDDSIRASVLQSMRDMYLTRSPENAALRSELRRQGIAGVKDTQMRRGFAQLSQANAWRISRMRHSHEVTEGMAELGHSKDIDSRLMLNEFKRRTAQTLTSPKPNKFLNGVSNLSHFMYLGFSPAYFLTNASQTWTTSLPIMAGRFGIARTSSMLAQVSKQVIPMLAKAGYENVVRDGIAGLSIDLDIPSLKKSLNLSDGEVKLLERLTENGALDITMRHDIGSVASGESSNFTTAALELSSVISNYPEVYNRLTTALVAYRLEMQYSHDKDEAHDNAVRYADKVIDNTHLNYSEENAPRFMRGNIARVAFQFKRYMQGMIYLLASTGAKMYKGKTPEERAEARRAFGYLMGANMAVAGTSGLFVAAPVTLLAKLISKAWDDDDEPQIMEEIYLGMKDAIGETAARAIVKGLPTLIGTDVSGSMGQGNLLNPVAFANTQGKETFSQDWFAAVALALAGPGPGLAAKWGQAAVDASHGEMYRAAQEAVPRFMVGPMKAYAMAERGVESRNGDQLMSPDEFNGFDTGMQALGFGSVKTSDMYDARAAFNEMRKNKQQSRSELLKSYIKARTSGEGMSDVMDEIYGFNSRHPDDRIQYKSLHAAYVKSQQQQREMRSGVRVGKHDRGVAEELGLE